LVNACFAAKAVIREPTQLAFSTDNNEHQRMRVWPNWLLDCDSALTSELPRLAVT
jgi:hypothetical protein